MSESSTPQGCTAMCRGSPSRRSTSGRRDRGAPRQPAGPQLGQLSQRDPGIAGPDVRERLGDRVDLPGRHAQGGPDVADRVADAVGVHHRHADTALPAVLVEDRLVDLEPARRLHVDVDVGQRGAQRREEPLHQQAVPDRVDPGDAEEVVDQAAGAGAAGGAADAHLADQVGDVGDGEEVGGIAEAADQLELVVEALPDALARRRAVAVADRCLAAGAEHRRRRWCLPPTTRTPGSAPRRCRGRRAGRGRSGRPRPGSGPAAAAPPSRCRWRDRTAGRSPRPSRASACRTSRSPRRCRDRRGAGRGRPVAAPRRARRRSGRRGGRRSAPRWSAPSPARPAGRSRPSARRARSCPAAGARPARR